MSVLEYDNFVGPWHVIDDVFANVSIHKFTVLKEKLVALNKGISFPLGLFQSLVREIKKTSDSFPIIGVCSAVLQDASHTVGRMWNMSNFWHIQGQ